MPTAPTSHSRGGARPGTGAPLRNINALRTGARSRRLAPLFRSAGLRGRAYIVQAITHAVQDARAHAATGPSGRRPRKDAPARHRTAARGHALARVLTCLDSAEFPAKTTWAARARDLLVALAPSGSTPRSLRMSPSRLRRIRRLRTSE